MAYTAVSDIVEPSVYLQYLLEQTTKTHALIKSGIMVSNPLIVEKLAGGGSTFNVPMWKRPTEASTALQSGTSLTPIALSTATQVVRRQVWGKGFADEDLAGVLAGSDPLGALITFLVDYWNQELTAAVNATIRGVIADNVSADSSDLINDIAGEDGDNATDAQLVDADGIIDTVALLGDKILDFTGIAMHSKVYARLAKLNLIDTKSLSEQNIGFGTFLGMSVVVDDDIYYVAGTTSGYKYWSVLYKNGGINWGEGGYSAGKTQVGVVPVEWDRTAASGVDNLYTRRQWAIAPVGFSADGSIANETPTLVELYTAGTWDRVFEKKNCGFVVLKTNG